MAQQIYSIAQLKEIIADSELCLVYFRSLDCAVCHALLPKIEQLVTARFPLIKFVFVETTELPEVAAEFTILSAPSLVFFIQGQEQQRWQRQIALGPLQEALDRPYQIFHQ